MIKPNKYSPSVYRHHDIVIDKFCVLQRVSESSVLLRVNRAAISCLSSNNDNGQNEFSEHKMLTHSMQAQNNKIIEYLARILALSPLWLKDYIVSYDSLLLIYDALQSDFYAVLKCIKSAANASNANALLANDEFRTHVIEVCYAINDEEFPNDLNLVEQTTGLTKHQIIELHQSNSYQVFAIGFMPNFAYLGELPDALHVPRLTTPRQRVPAGAVAIADKQTAVYPSESPGGWHIIGYTAFTFTSDGENTIAPADKVRFSGIDEQVFRQHKQRSFKQDGRVNAHPSHITNQAVK